MLQPIARPKAALYIVPAQRLVCVTRSAHSSTLLTPHNPARREHKKSCRAIPDAVVDARPNTLELAFNLLAINPVLQDYIMLLASSAIDIPANPNAFQTQYVMMDWSLKKRRGLPDTVHITGLSTYAIADGPELIQEAVRNQRANRGDPTFYMLYEARGPHGPFVQLLMNDPLPASMIQVKYLRCMAYVSTWAH